MARMQAEQLSFRYPSEGQTLPLTLKEISLTIEAGSFVAILGHNGSGKSTFAKHCNGILLPTGGKFWVDGLSTDQESHLLDIRCRVGMVFQNPDNQIVANVVEEDVAFGPENMGVPSAEIRERVAEALEIVGMSAFRQHAPHLLSGGQKQRIAIAGVLAMRPECIVLDEATAMLDPMGRREVLETVARLNRERGMTVLLITHHMEEAILADRVIVMEAGKVVLDGTPEAVFSQSEALRTWGLTVPDTVTLTEALREEGFDLPKTTLSVEDCAAQIATAFSY